MTNCQPLDSKAPPPSSSFNDLAEPVRRWIWEKNWSCLRDIQERSIPLLMKNRDDVIISAATAGGKTEAAFLPLISRLIEQTSTVKTGFSLLYIGPLKALINDQFKRLEDLCERTGVPVHKWHGDVAQSAKAKARKNPSGILLITPESLEALFVLRGLEVPALFASCDTVVIDELHAFLDTERGIQLRSLLVRLELVLGWDIRRIGLSATLGNMELAKSYLRPNDPGRVKLLQSSERTELKVQLRGYCPDSTLANEETGTNSISEHLFRVLRGKQNLIFAGSRKNVEFYSDALRTMSEKLGIPNEFFPHHSNLARAHRQYIEDRLKKAVEPTTAVCTSTLELGIDIGDIEQVAQIGAPYSVASLRQRLGRSGRRDNQSAVLRVYIEEVPLTSKTDLIDSLRLELVRAVAMIELLIEGWCEPPMPDALHLSTLQQQIMSVIAQNGGATAKNLFEILCVKGPFYQTSQVLFVQLLQAMGNAETNLIEQALDGTILLGSKGEKVVEHYTFYAAFETPEEYRILSKGKELGTLPILYALTPKSTIIFSGRRWQIIQVDSQDKVIEVMPDPTGVPPKFSGTGGLIHDEIVKKMRSILADNICPCYLDRTALNLLQEARSGFHHLGLAQKNVIEIADSRILLAVWLGSSKTNTVALALNILGIRTETYDGLIVAKGSSAEIHSALERLASGTAVSEKDFLNHASLPKSEKYHPYLPNNLLFEDIKSNRLDIKSLPEIARSILR